LFWGGGKINKSFLLNIVLKLLATQWAQSWGLMGEYNILSKLIYNLDELVYDGGWQYVCSQAKDNKSIAKKSK
jgi:hypothetical protein